MGIFMVVKSAAINVAKNKVAQDLGKAALTSGVGVLAVELTTKMVTGVKRKLKTDKGLPKNYWKETFDAIEA